MREHVAAFYDWDVNSVYENLYNRRNQWLHGAEYPRREYGVVMNYICLIAWGDLTDGLSDW